MSLKSVSIPTANQAADLQAALQAELDDNSFEAVQIHDNIVIMDDGANLAHAIYTVVPIPADLDKVALDAALNAASGSLIGIHPNFALFATVT